MRAILSDAIIFTNEKNEEKGINFEVEYYLLESIIKCVSGADDTLYGMDIIKKCDGNIVDRQTICDVMPSKYQTQEIIDIMAKNKVTPISVLDVLDDILVEI